MGKFKVGDRVAVYERRLRLTGLVHSFDMDRGLRVAIDGRDVQALDAWHPKQCRKLVKKERRRWTLEWDNMGGKFNLLEGQRPVWREQIEVVEVRKRKD